MFEGISNDRILQMTNQEKRWFDNIRKAFFHSDVEMENGTPEDRCLEELFKAIDTAKTLRRSLRGEDISNKNNRKRFIEFLALEIPCIKEELEADLKEVRSGQLKLGNKIYKIRCMIHENENLNFDENVSYQILLDWSNRDNSWVKNINDRFVFNGYFLWDRLRQILSKFITYIDSVFSLANEHTFCCTINPKIGSIKHLKEQY